MRGRFGRLNSYWFDSGRGELGKGGALLSRWLVLTACWGFGCQKALRFVQGWEKDGETPLAFDQSQSYDFLVVVCFGLMNLLAVATREFSYYMIFWAMWCWGDGIRGWDLGEVVRAIVTTWFEFGWFLPNSIARILFNSQFLRTIRTLGHCTNMTLNLRRTLFTVL